MLSNNSVGRVCNRENISNQVSVTLMSSQALLCSYGWYSAVLREQQALEENRCTKCVNCNECDESCAKDRTEGNHYLFVETFTIPAERNREEAPRRPEWNGLSLPEVSYCEKKGQTCATEEPSEKKSKRRSRI